MAESRPDRAAPAAAPPPSPPDILGAAYAPAMSRRFAHAAKGLSSRRLALDLGTSGESVRRYRRGLSSLPAPIAARFCELHDVSPLWLLCGIGPMSLRKLCEAAAGTGAPCTATRALSTALATDGGIHVITEAKPPRPRETESAVALSPPRR